MDNKKLILLGLIGIGAAIALSKNGSAKHPPTQENMIPNADFTQGLTGWDPYLLGGYMKFEESNTSLEGKGMKMTANNSYIEIYGETVCSSMMILNPGVYSLKFWHKGSGGFMVGVSTVSGVDLTKDNPSDWIIYDPVNDRTPYDDPVNGSYVVVNQDLDWKEYSILIDLPIGQGEYCVKIAMRNFNADWNNTPSYLDSFNFQKTIIAGYSPAGVVSNNCSTCTRPKIGAFDAHI